MSAVAATATLSSSPLWFITRSTGVVAFVALTVATVLGVAATQRAVASPAWPRFATQALHRNVSLLAMVLLLVHVVTTVLDGYVPIGWLAVVVPGTSGYRTLWVALGALAFDLLLLVTVTSALRLRMSQRGWRAVHLGSYAAWPLALLHFLTTGTDAVHGGWGRWLGIGLALVVLVAGGVRLASGNAPGPLRSLRGRAS